MPKPLLIVQHISHEGPGLLAELIGQYALPVATIDLSKGNRYPDPRNYAAVISLGGPESANDTTPKRIAELDRIRIIIDDNIPYLGICLGMQTLVKAAGGNVHPCSTRETGLFAPDGTPFCVDLTHAGSVDPLFSGLSKTLRVFQLHGETVELQEGISLLATAKLCKNQIVRVNKRAYGIQPHFELTPGMLDTLLLYDEYLGKIGREKLIEEFNDIRADYEKTCTTLLKNFLQIAEVV